MCFVFVWVNVLLIFVVVVCSVQRFVGLKLLLLGGREVNIGVVLRS